MDDSALEEAYHQLQQGAMKPLDPSSVVSNAVHGLATLRIHILVIFPSKLPSRVSALHLAASIYSCCEVLV